MTDQVIIIGAGGHACVAADIVRAMGLGLRGFLDDQEPAQLSSINLLGRVSDLPRFQEGHVFICAIGSYAARKAIMQHQVTWLSAIHPSAVVAPDVRIGEGTLVAANAVINPGSEIGRGCIINTAATVDHDCHLGDYVHLSPGAHLAGTVRVGEGAWLGVGAVVSNNLSICAHSVIGAGAAVVRDITKAGTYVGVPARLMEERGI